MRVKNLKVDFVITITGILSVLYSFLIFFLAILTITGIPIFGDLPPAHIRPETIIFFLIGLFYLILPVRLLIIRRSQRLSRWMEYTVLLMGLSPIFLFWWLVMQ